MAIQINKTKEEIQAEINILSRFISFDIDIEIQKLEEEKKLAKSIDDIVKQTYIEALNVGTSIISLASKPRFKVYSEKDMEKVFTESRRGLSKNELLYCKYEDFNDYLKQNDTN
jgi:hypothetical protein